MKNYKFVHFRYGKESDVHVRFAKNNNFGESWGFIYPFIIRIPIFAGGRSIESLFFNLLPKFGRIRLEKMVRSKHWKTS